MHTITQLKPASIEVDVGKFESNLDVNILSADTYRFIKDNILPPFNWPMFERVLEEHQSNRLVRRNADVDVFPIAACLAAGGTAVQAMPLASSWALYIFAGRLFDDLVDGEGNERNLFAASTAPTRLSTCFFAISAANAALAHLDDIEAYRDIATAFSQAVGLAVKSENNRQALDQLSLEMYFETIAAKTGAIFAVGAWAGGRIAAREYSEEVLTALHRYGLHVGMMTQILDDCLDLKTDLANQVWTLPVIYALSQEDHPLSSRLRSLLACQLQIESDWLEEAVEIMAQINAIPWSLQLAEIHRHQAWAAISDLLPDAGILRHYVTPKDK